MLVIFLMLNHVENVLTDTLSQIIITCSLNLVIPIKSENDMVNLLHFIYNIRNSFLEDCFHYLG